MSESPISVLLVEDNPIHARLLQGLLNDVRGQRYEVEAVETMTAGLRRLDQGGVDVVLLDLVLPDSQELATFVHVRAHSPGVPIIILTGLDDMDLAARAVEAGAQDYLVKTQINSTVLARSIHYAMQRGSARGQEWDSPLFRLAQQQLLKAAHMMDLEDLLLQRLLFPQRTLLVSFPFRHDVEGQVETLFGYRAQHLTALGPTLGGIRYHPQVRLGDVSALALGMTWKCALMQLPYGGAHGGVRVDPGTCSRRELRRITLGYTAEILGMIGPETDIPAPDTGTDEQVMAWVLDAYSRRAGYAVPAAVTGKPVLLGGTVERRQIAGRGLVFALDAAARALDIQLDGARVVVQGFGDMGRNAALRLISCGVRVVAVSDASGGSYSTNGLDLAAVDQHMAGHGSLKGCAGGDTVTNGELLELPCDILVAAAAPNQITSRNADRIRCRIVAEGADGSTTLEADEVLAERGVFVLPDTVANAGSALASHFEWLQQTRERPWTLDEMDARLEHLVTAAFRRAHHRAQQQQVDMRTATLMEAIDRVRQVELLRDPSG